MSNKNYRSKNASNAFVYGNTARKISVVPSNSAEREKIDAEQKRKERAVAYKKAKVTHRLNFVYTMAVIGIVGFIFVMCVQYLHLQAQVKGSAHDISTMSLQLSQMTENNDSEELRVKAGIDYNKILDTAVHELGMVYPKKNQVIQYNSSESEYVKQYSDIPDNNE